MWLDQPDIAPVDREVMGPIEAAADALAAAGAKVDVDARPDFDIAEFHATYLQLLLATLGARNPGYDEMVERAAALDPADDSPYAQSAARLDRSSP